MTILALFFLSAFFGIGSHFDKLATILLALVELGVVGFFLFGPAWLLGRLLVKVGIPRTWSSLGTGLAGMVWFFLLCSLLFGNVRHVSDAGALAMTLAFAAPFVYLSSILLAVAFALKGPYRGREAPTPADRKASAITSAFWLALPAALFYLRLRHH